MVAYGHDGSWFRAQRINTKDLDVALDIARIELKNQGQLALLRGLSLIGLEAHLVNLALQAAGMIDYTFSLNPLRAQFFADEQQALGQIVKALTQRIQQHLREK